MFLYISIQSNYKIYRTILNMILFKYKPSKSRKITCTHINMKIDKPHSDHMRQALCFSTGCNARGRINYSARLRLRVFVFRYSAVLYTKKHRHYIHTIGNSHYYFLIPQSFLKVGQNYQIYIIYASYSSMSVWRCI